jgi:hypothetical protein
MKEGRFPWESPFFVCFIYTVFFFSPSPPRQSRGMELFYHKAVGNTGNFGLRAVLWGGDFQDQKSNDRSAKTQNGRIFMIFPPRIGKSALPPR